MGKLMVGVRRVLPLCAVLLLVLPAMMLPDTAFAQAPPRITLIANQTSFESGDTHILTATVTPGGSASPVDVYVAVQLPDQTLFFYQSNGSFTTEMQPLVRSWTVSPFSGEIFRYTFSGAEPAGTYTWYAAFTNPGTLNFIGDIAQAPFTFEGTFTFETQDFGSFAYSPSTGVVASNIGYSKAEAQAAAEEACRSQGGDWGECQAAAWFRNSFGAFALASNGSWGWGRGSQAADADYWAMKYCQGGGSDCQIVRRERTASIEITSLAGGESVAPMRWNWSALGFTEGQGDHNSRDYWAVDFVSDDPPIYPVRPGRVVFAGWDCRTLTGAPPCYGNVVVVDHGNGTSSLYAHLAAGSLPVVGRDVGIDDRIGIMSDSGCVGCGVHLHFAVRSGCVTPDSLCRNPDPLYTPQTPVRTPWRYGMRHSEPLMGPVVVRSETFREGQLVFFRLFFTDPNNDAEGFGFRGANGSLWAEEEHPFSEPSYGRVSPGTIEYPFNLACGTVYQYESDVEAWIYDGAGLRSRSVTVHLACSAP